jgi:hypothetical protein
MTTLEKIQTNLEQLSEAELVQLYAVIQEMRTKPKGQSMSLMAKLRSVKIEAPEDFSANVDDYLNQAHHDDIANLP